MNLTFRNLSLVLSFVLLSTIAFAQGERFNIEKIEAAKIAFFTQKLDLSADQAKVFWPIYNDYQREQEALRAAQRQKMISYRKVKEIDEMTDAEVQAFIYNDFNFRQKDLNVDKKYYNKFKASLPIKIVGKFYRAQEAFKRELLNQFRGGGSRRTN
ncbi:hypothetical protein WG904_07745 [Pedobacter sp. Du54]|uniref:hypothetical protein n=1 Tax=Pedobacter anseongensis TaxID=3133439 RepID=UPI00309CF7E0